MSNPWSSRWACLETLSERCACFCCGLAGFCLLSSMLCPDNAAYLQVEMGSTNVRVGSTIFGARDYENKS